MDFLSSETDDDDDVSDVDPEELQKMLEVCLVFILLKFNYLVGFKFNHFGVTYVSHYHFTIFRSIAENIICQGLC